MRLAAHQPQYMPWLGYFDKMDRVDLFVLLDTVQYKKNEWQNRNRIRTAAGWQWLTVPVHYRFPMTIREVRIDETAAWRRKHREALRTLYARAPHRGAAQAAIEAILEERFPNLAALNERTVKILAGLLGVRTPIVVASQLGDLPGGADDRLIALCRRFGCSTYLAGAGGQSYMDLEAYRRAGIRVEFQPFRHPVYRQVHAGFEPGLSAIDCLMNCGPGAIRMVRGLREVRA
ncbi:MAG: WbqC family protein [Acidobacteriota bacterium]